MLYYYFITLDRVQGMTKPTYLDFQCVLRHVCERLSFYCIIPHKVESIEFKEKGSTRNKTKCYNWPHYHCIVGSWLRKSRPKFSYPGWSVSIKYLHSPSDIIKAAGYVYKGHKPDAMYLCKNDYKYVKHLG